MSKSVDIFIVYEILKRLTTPFRDSKAYKMGLIDDSGNLTKPRNKMSAKEKKSVTLFDLMIFNIKKVFALVPGRTGPRLKNFSSALYLLKEDIELGDVDFDDVLVLAGHTLKEDSTEYKFNEMNESLSDIKWNFILIEDASAPATMTTGNVATKDMPLKTSKLGRCKVFHVDGKTFDSCRNPKKKKDRFGKYIEEGPAQQAIREYARKNPSESIMVRDESTGAHTFIKLGSKRRF